MHEHQNLNITCNGFQTMVCLDFNQISKNHGTQLICQLIDASILNKNKKCSAFQIMMHNHKHFNRSKAITFWLIVRFKHQNQSKFQQDLDDAWLLNALFPIAKLRTTADCQGTEMSHSKINFQLVADLILILNCEGAHVVPITFYSISEGTHVAPNTFCDRSFKLIIACIYFSSIFQDFSSSNFQLVVDYTLILHSEGAKTTLSMLIFGCGYSKTSFHFCKDCLIFYEGEW